MEKEEIEWLTKIFLYEFRDTINNKKIKNIYINSKENKNFKNLIAKIFKNKNLFYLNNLLNKELIKLKNIEEMENIIHSVSFDNTEKIKHTGDFKNSLNYIKNNNSTETLILINDFIENKINDFEEKSRTPKYFEYYCDFFFKNQELIKIYKESILKFKFNSITFTSLFIILKAKNLPISHFKHRNFIPTLDREPNNILIDLFYFLNEKELIDFLELILKEEINTLTIDINMDFLDNSLKNGLLVEKNEKAKIFLFLLKKIYLSINELKIDENSLDKNTINIKIINTFIDFFKKYFKEETMEIIKQELTRLYNEKREKLNSQNDLYSKYVIFKNNPTLFDGEIPENNFLKLFFEKERLNIHLTEKNKTINLKFEF